MSSKKIFAGIFFLSIWVGGTAWGANDEKNPGAMLRYEGISVPATTDDEEWIIYDNGSPQYYFPLPDEFDDHYFNVRFTAPDSCRLLTATFFFDQLTGNLPDVKILAWNSTGLLPDSTLDSLILGSANIHVYPDTTLVSLAAWDLRFSNGQKFHLGWEPADSLSPDTLAILSDDGIPETTNSVEWWGQINAWGTIQSHWGLGVNFMIRALVEILEDTTFVWLEPDRQPADFWLEGPYPNPFNPQATLVIHLQKPQNVSLQVYDSNGRFVGKIADALFPAGASNIRWQPHELASGTYVIRMVSPDRSVSTRATLLK